MPPQNITLKGKKEGARSNGGGFFWVASHIWAGEFALL